MSARGKLVNFRQNKQKKNLKPQMTQMWRHADPWPFPYFTVNTMETQNAPRERVFPGGTPRRGRPAVVAHGEQDDQHLPQAHDPWPRKGGQPSWALSRTTPPSAPPPQAGTGQAQPHSARTRGATKAARAQLHRAESTLASRLRVKGAAGRSARHRTRSESQQHSARESLASLSRQS